MRLVLSKSIKPIAIGSDSEPEETMGAGTHLARPPTAVRRASATAEIVHRESGIEWLADLPARFLRWIRASPGRLILDLLAERA